MRSKCLDSASSPLLSITRSFHLYSFTDDDDEEERISQKMTKCTKAKVITYHVIVNISTAVCCRWMSRNRSADDSEERKRRERLYRWTVESIRPIHRLVSLHALTQFHKFVVITFSLITRTLTSRLVTSGTDHWFISCHLSKEINKRNVQSNCLTAATCEQLAKKNS